MNETVLNVVLALSAIVAIWTIWAIARDRDGYGVSMLTVFALMFSAVFLFTGIGPIWLRRMDGAVYTNAIWLGWTLWGVLICGPVRLIAERKGWSDAARESAMMMGGFGVPAMTLCSLMVWAKYTSGG